MNRNIIIIFISFLALFSSCKKNEVAAYDEPVEVRTTKFLQDYQDVLTGAPNGWKVILTPREKNTYVFWMKFDTKNRVQMVVDMNEETATEIKESSYRFKALQQPMLLFDTYNYLHIIADPNGSISGSSSAGTGLQTDYQFYPDSAAARAIHNHTVKDSLQLVGQYNGIRITLVKATADEEAAYTKGELFTNMEKVSDYFATNTFHTLSFGDKLIEVQVAPLQRTVSFSSFDQNKVSTSSYYFSYTLDAIRIQPGYKAPDGTLITALKIQDNKLYAVFPDGKTTELVKKESTSIPLYLRIAASVNNFAIPDNVTYEGWSADFISRRAAANTNTMNTSYRLRIGEARMVFDNNSVFTLNMDVYQGTNRFLAVYNYTYTKADDGKLKFDYQSANGNGNLIISQVAPLLDERLNADTFTVEDYKTTTGAILAKFTSVEHPDFSFTATY